MSLSTETKISLDPLRPEVLVTREFNAPRMMVFQALTNPDLYARWIGPRNLTTHVETMQPCSGGAYRFIQYDMDGHIYAFHGVYHEVNFPERIVATFEYEGMPEKGHVSLDTYMLEELPNLRTRLVTRSVYLSLADRDDMARQGMEAGIQESYQRLDEVLGELMTTENRMVLEPCDG
jgi:uncharacterized protein YndB with AHSA1/START domain